MAESELEGRNLTELNDIVSRNYSNIERSSEASSSDNIQSIVKESIALCTRAIGMVNDLSLFGENEDLDELSSESLKFMTLPAFAGYFTCRVISKDRKELLETSKEYFSNFLKLCSNYSVIQEKANTGSDIRSIRDEKVRQLRHKKEIEKRIEELRQYVEKDHVDEEVKRDYYVNQIKRWIVIANEEIESADRELEILNMMAARGDELKLKSKESTTVKESFRPMILTRTKAQAKVFGAGYPSLPTYSVEEFFEMQLAEQQQLSGNNADASSGDQQTSKEELEERDDPDYIKEQRRWDEFKDEFRDGLSLRYGRPMTDLPSICDGCGETFSVNHGLNCKKCGLVIQRHNGIRDIVGDLCALAYDNRRGSGNRKNRG